MCKTFEEAIKYCFDALASGHFNGDEVAFRQNTYTLLENLYSKSITDIRTAMSREHNHRARGLLQKQKGI